MDNVYLCHYGTKGMHWGVRKPTQDSIRKKHSMYLDKAAKYETKSNKYRYRAGKQTQFTDLGVAKYNRLAKKSDKYFYKANRAAKRGKKYLNRMQKKHPELFDTEFRNLLQNDAMEKDVDRSYNW